MLQLGITEKGNDMIYYEIEMIDGLVFDPNTEVIEGRADGDLYLYSSNFEVCDEYDHINYVEKIDDVFDLISSYTILDLDEVIY